MGFKWIDGWIGSNFEKVAISLYRIHSSGLLPIYGCSHGMWHIINSNRCMCMCVCVRARAYVFARAHGRPQEFFGEENP